MKTKLIEFLTARLAEDEANAQDARVLADCEAKRRIVAAYEDIGRKMAAVGSPLELRSASVAALASLIGAAAAFEVSLESLAVSYRGHPDYLADWEYGGADYAAVHICVRHDWVAVEQLKNGTLVWICNKCDTDLIAPRDPASPGDPQEQE